MGAEVGTTLAEATIRSQTILRELRHFAPLQAAAEELINACSTSGFPVLIPASSEASALVGAAVVLGGGSISAVAPNDVPPGKVMVVESVAVSGLFVRQTVEALRKAEVDWIGVFVWRAESLRLLRETDWGQVDALVVGQSVSHKERAARAADPASTHSDVTSAAASVSAPSRFSPHARPI